jgi:N-acyl homoserine lactone hydrolase
MEEYKIIPIKVGEFQGIEKSNLTYQLDCGQKLVAPIIMYLIKGRDKAILVDTGGSNEEWAQKYHHGLRRTDEMHPVAGLKKAGVNVEDIELVVNTHLHWDHCFNNNLFVKAKIFVQKKEMQYAVSPLPSHYVYYESHQLGMQPQWFKAYDRITAVEGDVNLLPGLDLVTLPGHTPGFQGVLVNTAKGRYLIASDCLGLFENWAGNGIYKHIPSGIHYNLAEYYQTLEKIENLCDFILPGHDARVFEHDMYPYL